MLVLALEFSRGCTAHAGAGHLHSTNRKATQREQPPDRGTHGVSGPAGGNEREAATPDSRSSRRARLETWHGPAHGQRRRDVTGIDPKGHSLKTE